jgi:hypothetical protein
VSDEPDAIPLTGGRLTAGVVRVGDTVRRPTQPSSAFTEREPDRDTEYVTEFHR